MRIQPAGGLAAAPPQDPRPALRRLAHELEGVFMSQLFQAMRASVPESGLVESAPGKELFTSLMDERLAGEAAQRMRNGLGEALYRQLCRRLPPTEEAPR
jgi:Rod binding domain-containing protein